MFVNHLLFADDNILFGEATREGAENIRIALSEYEQASGQLVNYEKSSIYFGANVDYNTKASIRDVLKVKVASNLENYLRLLMMLMMVGRTRKRTLSHYIDRICKMVDN